MKTVALGDLTETIDTWNPSRNPTVEFRYVDLSAVDNESKQITRTTTFMGAEAPSRARQLLQAGDVLVSTVRPNLNAVAAVPSSLGGATASTGFTVLRPNAHLNPRYLFHWVRSRQFISDMVRKATGASYPAVSDKIVRGSKIPTPPVDEQRRIAALLDHADALRAKRRQVLAHLDALPQAMLQRALEAPGSAAVASVELGDALDFLTSGSRGWAKHYAKTGSKFLRIQNVGHDRLVTDDLAHVDPPASAEANRTRTQAGDVVLSITADLGRTAVIPSGFGDAHINQHLCILRTSRLNSRYLSAYLCSPGGQRQLQRRNRAAVKAGLNFDDVRSIRVPELSRGLQDLFEQQAAASEGMRDRARSALLTADGLFASLQSRAFRGEL